MQPRSQARPQASASRIATLLGHIPAVAALAAPLLLSLGLANHSLSDLDIWLHDRVGHQIMAGEGIPRTNDYSFTAPDHPWVDHEWLFQVGVAAVARPAVGPEKAAYWNGLRLVLIGLLVIVLLGGDGLLATAIGRRNWRRRAMTLAVPALITLALLWTRMILRPELISYLGFVLVVRWIDETTGSVWAMPPARASAHRHWFSPWHPSGRTMWLTLVWAQFHGFFIFVPVLWIGAAMLAPLRRWLPEISAGEISPATATASERGGGGIVRLSRACLGWAGLTFLAGLATPNGLAGLLYPFRALGQFGQTEVDLSEVISELAPLLATTDTLATTLLVFKISVAWAIVWLLVTGGRVSPLRIALWLATLAAALYSQRSLGFYSLAFYLIHSGYRSDGHLWWQKASRLWLEEKGTAWRGQAARWVPWGAAAAVFIVAAHWLPAIQNDRFYLAEGVARRFGSGLTPAQYPFHAVTTLRDHGHGTALRTINNVDVAALVVHEQAGRIYIDGRTEAYPASHWREYLQLRQGGEAAMHIIARWQTQAAVLAHRGPASHGLLQTLLASDQWRPVSADEAGIAFLPAKVVQSDVAQEVWQEALTRLHDSLPTPANGTAPGAGHRSVRSADRCLSLATLLKMAAQDSAAHQLYRLGLRYCFDHPVLNHNYGNILMEQGAFGQALEHYRRALAVNGRLVKTRVNAGICFFRLGDLTSAEQSFQTAARTDPARAEAWVNLAEVRRRRGDRAGALAAYERALDLLPHDTLLQERIKAYRRGG